ncbi:MAG: hypothetical protein NT163_10230 [Chlorobiales bacterium]|nr:hypothetical protein [Chlorobiales bacterium]
MHYLTNDTLKISMQAHRNARLDVVHYSPIARRIGILSSVMVVLLGVVYAGVMSLGILSLKGSKEPLGDPFFSVIELLLIVLALLMVSIMVVIHAWALPDQKSKSLLALFFMSLLAGLTCCVHFVILLVSHQITSANFLSFNWPSVVYVTDVLAWDGLFGLSALFAAPLFRGDRLRSSIRFLLVASGVLSIIGMIGMPFDDLSLRMMGLLGHAVIFPVAVMLLAVLFYRSPPVAVRNTLLPERSDEV